MGGRMRDSDCGQTEGEDAPGGHAFHFLLDCGSVGSALSRVPLHQHVILRRIAYRVFTNRPEFDV
jgi:hypothetical protein